ncbi:unnamed protein product, partial [Mesorhabditis spiculigera]
MNRRPSPKTTTELIDSGALFQVVHSNDDEKLLAFPCIIKWCEESYGELTCFLSLYKWEGVCYRLMFNEQTVFGENCEAGEFSKKYLPGDQFVAYVPLASVSSFGKERATLRETCDAQLVLASHLTTDLIISSESQRQLEPVECRLIRGDAEASYFESVLQSQHCKTIFPLQRCNLGREEVMSAGDSLAPGFPMPPHKCLDELSDCVVRGYRVKMPAWLQRLNRDFTKNDWLLVDFELPGDVTTVNASLVDVTTAKSSFNRRISTMKFMADGGKHKTPLTWSEEGNVIPKFMDDRFQTNENSFTLLLTKGFGKFPYKVQKWIYPGVEIEPGSSTKQALEKLAQHNDSNVPIYEGREDGTFRFKEKMPAGLQPADLAHSFSADGPKKPGSASVEEPEMIKINGFETSIFEERTQQSILKDVLHQKATCLPADPSYFYDFKGAPPYHTTSLRWRTFMDSSLHNDKRLIEIITVARQQLSKDAKLLQCGFKSRILWEALFMELSGRETLTRRDVRDAVHQAILEKVHAHGEVQKEVDEQAKAANEAAALDHYYETQHERVLKRLRELPLPADGFWPILRAETARPAPSELPSDC